MKNLIIFISLILINLIGSGCKETVDFYLGVPLQPELEENNFEPGLNIIGVLRPDFVDSSNRSFVFVQKVAPALSSTPEFNVDSMNVSDAIVRVTNETDNSEILFARNEFDSTFSDVRYRPESYFEVRAGYGYSISCSSKDLPVLTSSTVIPNQPQIIPGSIKIIDNLIEFETENDSSIFLFEVYLYQNDSLNGFRRQVANATGNTSFSIPFEGNIPDRMEIFGYDYNISSYLTISNTNLNFNKYRKPFGNVENGYGVFGSLNYISIQLR